VLDLLRDGVCWLKMSAPYIMSRQKESFADVQPFAEALVEAAPDRLVWATDWPHPFCGDSPPSDADLLALFHRWVPDAALRKRILVDNPATLYGFPQR
jgi:predicted TIM-barrel fold metal-dependent hydrolase